MNITKLKTAFSCARLALMVLAYSLSPLAHALSGQQAGQNVTQFFQVLINVITVLGVLAGLGFVLSGLFSAYKKYDRGNDDVTWGKIAMQIGAGGLCMALAAVGIMVVETLGGSATDIGRSLS
jgi:hypothetical protein